MPMKLIEAYLRMALCSAARDGPHCTAQYGSQTWCRIDYTYLRRPEGRLPE